MGELLVDLLPLSVGAALLPVWIIMVLFLLGGKEGWRTAGAFVGGALLVRVVQGVLFGYVFGVADEAHSPGGKGLIAATLLLVIGIMMLVAAYMKWRKQPDADDPPPKWMAMLDGLSAPKALLFGAGLMAVAVKQWVFTLSALAIVRDAPLGGLEQALGFLFFVLVAQSLMIAPILLYVLMPARAAQWLAALQRWLARYERVIMIAASLIFGLWFVFKGITGLMS